MVLRQPLTQPATPSLGFSVKELHDYRAASKTLEGLVEYHTMYVHAARRRRAAARAQTGVVSPDFFDLLGVRAAPRPDLPRRGRPPGADAGARAELRLLAAPLRRRPGRRRHGVQMNDRAHTVVGVLPTVPQYPERERRLHAELGLPVPLERADAREPRRADAERLGRLRPGVTLEQAQADVALGRRAASPQTTRTPTRRASGFTATAVGLARGADAAARGRRSWCCWAPSAACC